jgi:hypothetical protein
MANKLRRNWMAVGGLVPALAVGACGMDRDSSTAVPGAEGTPMTLTGCLQQSDGDLVLTTRNEPTGTPGAVGTAGADTAGSPSAAEDHMQAAADAYRLEGDEASLRSHIGKQVRVTGTLEEESDVAPRAGTGSGESDRADVDPGDLAALDVTTVEAVAETCGTGD